MNETNNAAISGGCFFVFIRGARFGLVAASAHRQYAAARPYNLVDLKFFDLCKRDDLSAVMRFFLEFRKTKDTKK